VKGDIAFDFPHDLANAAVPGSTRIGNLAVHSASAIDGVMMAGV
jgi:hypothetical protein